MKRIDLNNTSELLSHIDLNQYPLVNHYLDYDECYMDDDWVKYSIYYDETDTPVAVIAKRLPEEQIGHILILEVDKDQHSKGIGKNVILDYMKDKEYWELWSVENAEGFYKKLGFTMSKKSDLFNWGFVD
jgi:N-acetylglutamate synthase-like GNAT family acetyltransferase